MTTDGVPTETNDDAGTGDLDSRLGRVAVFAANRDVRCPRCEYNLRDLRGTTCPECGEELDVDIRLAHPHIGPYIALLAAVAMGFGGSVLFGCLALVGAPNSWWRDLAARLLLLMFALALISLPLVILLRRRLWRFSRRTQRVIAIVAWLILLTISTGILATFKE